MLLRITVINTNIKSNHCRNTGHFYTAWQIIKYLLVINFQTYGSPVVIHIKLIVFHKYGIMKKWIINLLYKKSLNSFIFLAMYNLNTKSFIQKLIKNMSKICYIEMIIKFRPLFLLILFLHVQDTYYFIEVAKLLFL